MASLMCLHLSVVAPTTRPCVTTAWDGQPDSAVGAACGARLSRFLPGLTAPRLLLRSVQRRATPPVYRESGPCHFQCVPKLRESPTEWPFGRSRHLELLPLEASPRPHAFVQDERLAPQVRLHLLLLLLRWRLQAGPVLVP
eukprot:6486040-Amphidinium_carterae.2